MKKVLLLSLSLALGFSAFAQRQVIKNDVRQTTASSKVTAVGKEMATEASNYLPQESRSVVVNRYDDMEDGETMWTHYDLQSNAFVANRMYQLPTGEVAVVATMSHINSNQSVPDRGTGYNFYDGSSWLDQPESRIETFMAGWPSIAQWGERGEILLCHGNGAMNCFTREVAGEGEWQFMGELPSYPEGYPYNEYPTWPRVVTCGDNHNIIIAVAALQHTISSDETDVRTVMFRSEDATNWTVEYTPLAEFGYETGVFSADDYSLAANGHTVAMLFSGSLTNSVWMFKSTDDGLTWTPTKVWENPYEGREFDEEPAWGMEDTLSYPMNSAIVIDNSGVAHVALNTFDMIHTLENEPGYYTAFSGRSSDGIYYWNDTQEAPIQSPDGNPHHALSLWWPDEENPGYVTMHNDSTKWIGMIPMYYDENGALIQWENSKFYHENEYFHRFYSASGHLALSCDPQGNLACAFSSPCTKREDGETVSHYYRSIYVSYRNVDEGYWHQLEDELTDDEVDFMYMLSENMFTISVPNTVNDGEFWFGYQTDDVIGLYWGSNASQTTGTENIIHAVKVIASPEMVSVPENNDAKDVIYSVYPNPATNYMVVSSAQETDATITIYNLVGQTVQQFNKRLGTGENTINIDLKSGVYFCTISANGFDKTVKVVVK